MDLSSISDRGDGLLSSDAGYFKLMLDTVSFIYQDKELSTRINHILGMIGTFINASRVYVFEDDHDAGISCNTYEWCADGVTPQKDALQAVPLAEIESWHAALLRDGIIRADDINDLAPEVCEILAEQGVFSIVVLPLSMEDKMLGYIGFDECRACRRWSEREIEVLRALSTLVTTLISRHSIENMLHASHRRFRTVMDNIEIPIYVTDLETSRVLFANKRFAEVTQDDHSEGKICWKVLSRNPEGRCPDCPRESLLSMPEGSVFKWEAFNKKDGKWYYCTDSLIEWVDGRRAHLQSAVEITARKEYEEKLMVSASSDAMTGIYNRESGMQLAKDLIETGRRENFISTICYIDLDDLKHVNDNYGHPEGDRLILTTVEAISAIVRNTDIFARLGGDEFMVMLRSCNATNARRVISNVQRKLMQVNLSKRLPYHLSFSAGFAEILPEDPCKDAEEYLARADKDMYLNKQAKKEE